MVLRFALCGFQSSGALLWGLTTKYLPLFERVTTAAGIHLFPFRTEKLSPPAPMVLRGRLRGRVGRRPFFLPVSDSRHQVVRGPPFGLGLVCVGSRRRYYGCIRLRFAY